MSGQDFTSLLKKLISEDTLRGISSAVGTGETQTKTAVKTALPKLIEALLKNSESEEGATSLASALDDHDGSSLKDILATILDNRTQADGAKILGHVFGHNKTDVEKNIASTSGISTPQAANILQTVAPLLLEALGKTRQENGLNQNDITGVLSGILNNQSGGLSQGGLFDQNNDGEIRDDILTMILNWFKKIFFKK